MGNRSQKFFRISVDLTPQQHEIFDQIQDALSTRHKAKISRRTLIHLLLEQQAKDLGLEWPADYPSHGGSRT